MFKYFNTTLNLNAVYSKHRGLTNKNKNNLCLLKLPNMGFSKEYNINNSKTTRIKEVEFSKNKKLNKDLSGYTINSSCGTFNDEPEYVAKRLANSSNQIPVRRNKSKYAYTWRFKYTGLFSAYNKSDFWEPKSTLNRLLCSNGYVYRAWIRLSFILIYYIQSYFFMKPINQIAVILLHITVIEIFVYFCYKVCAISLQVESGLERKFALTIVSVVVIFMKILNFKTPFIFELYTLDLQTCIQLFISSSTQITIIIVIFVIEIAVSQFVIHEILWASILSVIWFLFLWHFFCNFFMSLTSIAFAVTSVVFTILLLSTLYWYIFIIKTFEDWLIVVSIFFTSISSELSRFFTNVWRDKYSNYLYHIIKVDPVNYKLHKNQIVSKLDLLEKSLYNVKPDISKLNISDPSLIIDRFNGKLNFISDFYRFDFQLFSEFVVYYKLVIDRKSIFDVWRISFDYRSLFDGYNSIFNNSLLKDKKIFALSQGCYNPCKRCYTPNFRTYEYNSVSYKTFKDFYFLEPFITKITCISFLLLLFAIMIKIIKPLVNYLVVLLFNYFNDLDGDLIFENSRLVKISTSVGEKKIMVYEFENCSNTGPEVYKEGFYCVDGKKIRLLEFSYILCKNVMTPHLFFLIMCLLLFLYKHSTPYVSLDFIITRYDFTVYSFKLLVLIYAFSFIRFFGELLKFIYDYENHTALLLTSVCLLKLIIIAFLMLSHSELLQNINIINNNLVIIDYASKGFTHTLGSEQKSAEYILSHNNTPFIYTLLACCLFLYAITLRRFHKYKSYYILGCFFFKRNIILLFLIFNISLDTLLYTLLLAQELPTVILNFTLNFAEYIINYNSDTTESLSVILNFGFNFVEQSVYHNSGAPKYVESYIKPIRLVLLNNNAFYLYVLTINIITTFIYVKFILLYGFQRNKQGNIIGNKKLVYWVNPITISKLLLWSFLLCLMQLILIYAIIYYHHLCHFWFEVRIFTFYYNAIKLFTIATFVILLLNTVYQAIFKNK